MCRQRTVLFVATHLGVMNKRKNNFTIVELVVAIIIIALFFVLIDPPVFISQNSAKKARAQAEIIAISTAIKQYKNIYGQLPLGKGKTEQYIVVDNEYEVLMELLSCVDGPDQGTNINKNTRGTRFLSVSKNFPEKGYIDPWGKKFRIYIDTNNNNKISFGGKEISAIVLVYSLGKNKIDNKGSEDDICSWK